MAIIPAHEKKRDLDEVFEPPARHHVVSEQMDHGLNQTYGGAQGIGFPIYSQGRLHGRGFYRLTARAEKDRYGHHYPVLSDEVVFWILTEIRGAYLDCTIGGGSHADAVLSRLVPPGILLGMDRDKEAIEHVRERLSGHSSLKLRHGNFSGMGEFLREEGVVQLDGVLMDLGVSSHQIDADYRGFSFMREGRLDMRFGRDQQLNAEQVINEYSQKELERIFFEYGEERRSRAVAQRIINRRAQKRIETTTELAEIIKSGFHPAYVQKSLARIFQAIRIEVNGELDHLRNGLIAALDHLKPGGRIVVISYHSLEDRIVKQFFRANVKRCVCPPDFPVCRCGTVGRLKILTKKPVRPDQEEIVLNQRSRSAKLRVAEKL